MCFHLNHTVTPAIRSVRLSTSTEQPTAASAPAVSTDTGQWFDSAPKADTLDLLASLEVLLALSKYYVMNSHVIHMDRVGIAGEGEAQGCLNSSCFQPPYSLLFFNYHDFSRALLILLVIF